METAETPNAEVEKSKKVSRLHFEVKTVNTQEGTEVAPSIEATKGAHREAVRTTGEEEPTHPSPQQIEARTENRDVGQQRHNALLGTKERNADPEEEIGKAVAKGHAGHRTHAGSARNGERGDGEGASNIEEATKLPPQGQISQWPTYVKI